MTKPIDTRGRVALGKSFESTRTKSPDWLQVHNTVVHTYFVCSQHLKRFEMIALGLDNTNSNTIPIQIDWNGIRSLGHLTAMYHKTGLMQLLTSRLQ